MKKLQKFGDTKKLWKWVGEEEVGRVGGGGNEETKTKNRWTNFVICQLF
jgi:hypothetical protein